MNLEDSQRFTIRRVSRKQVRIFIYCVELLLRLAQQMFGGVITQ